MTATATQPTPAPGSAPLTVQNRRKRDLASWYVVAVSTVLSISAYWYFASAGATKAYLDGIAHLQIASRFLQSPTPGVGQLGGVWLPLPHILAAPFTLVDDWYFSGFAGAVVSMVAYITTNWLVYKISFRLTGSKLAGVAAAAVFGLNPNILYLQSTPMTELLLFACTAGLVYGVQRWAQTDHYRYLLWGAVAGVLGCATRYEAWVSVGLMSVVVLVIAWNRRKTMERGYTLAMVIAFSLLGLIIPIAGWLTWNGLTFGDWLAWKNGAYAKSSLWVSETDPVVGSWSTSLKTYYYAALENLTPLICVLALLGLTALLFRERLAAKNLPILSQLGLFAFFVYALEAGERPLYVEQVVPDDLYNVRFGLSMLLPAAVLTGYLVVLFRNRLRIRPIIAVILVVIASGISVYSYAAPAERIITYAEPLSDTDEPLIVAEGEASQFMAANYRDGEDILMMSFGNELLLPQAGIGTANHIYEGSNRLWQPALADPAGHGIPWVIFRLGGIEKQQDEVHDRLAGTPQLDNDYTELFRNDYYVVYRLNGGAA